MIQTPTTFVVGAGASESYGLPVASDLTRAAKELDARSDIYQLLLCVSDVEKLDSLLRDLKNHAWESIDDFLEHRQQHPELMRVGKTLLAALMGQAIARARKPWTSAKDDWLLRIIRFMAKRAPTAADFAAGNSKVSFITFNFDSVVEERIKAVLDEIYARDDVVTAAKAFQVIHVHGQLPPVPIEPICDESLVVGRTPAGVSGQWISWTKDAALKVHVTLDDIDKPLLNLVQDLISETKILCFLGFAYDKDNLAKLGVPARLKHDTYMTAFGSAFGVLPADRQRLEERFGQTPIALGPESQKCLALLNQYNVLRD